MRQEIKERIAMIEREEVPEGYKKTKNGVIPKEWQTSTLGNFVIDMKSGLSRKLSDSDIGLPVIRSNNIVGNKIHFDDIKYWYIDDPQGSNAGNYFLRDGDILVNFINSISQIGKVAMFKNEIGRDVIFTTNILKMTLSEKLNKSYFMYFSETEKYLNYIKSITKPAVNQASFTTVEYKRMELAIPPIPEQEKIAFVLSAWDRAIELKEMLLEQKKLQKKGLMARLLTGKVRLPRFYGRWEKKQLRDVFKRVTRRNNAGSTNVLTISAQRGLVSQTDYFNKSVASETLDNYFLLKKGEFAYNKSYSKGYPMGAIKRLNGYAEGVVTTLYICFKFKDENTYSSDFFEQYFEAGMLTKALMQITQEGARAHGLLNIAVNDFFTINILIPPKLEQEAIAAILVQSDRSISILEQELDQLKLQKKGLMQLLLTGKVRVPC